jgi:hypothetical protein
MGRPTIAGQPIDQIIRFSCSLTGPLSYSLTGSLSYSLTGSLSYSLTGVTFSAAGPF